MRKFLLFFVISIIFGFSHQPVFGQLNKLKQKANQTIKPKSEGNQNQPTNQPDQKSEAAPKEEASPSDNAAISEGKTIYVSISKGNNGNDGSSSAPMKNIDKAIAKAGPGDNIYIAEGFYSGTFKVGYLESDKPLKLFGSWDENFTKQDIVNHPTVFQPDNESGGKGRKALLRFTKDVAGTVVDGIVFDMGERNLYDEKDGMVEGVEGGRLRMSSEPVPGKNSTVEEPAISFLSAATGGDVTIQNCVIVNGAMYGVQAGHRSGTFRVLNNVFVSNRMASIEVYGTCAGSNQKKDMISCGEVEIANNTILFTWSRLKDFMDMGYGARIMTKANYNIHHNIIGTSIMGGIDNSRFCKDEYIRIDDNILFGNKGGDLEYFPDGNVELKLYVQDFGDLEFASVKNNSAEVPGIKVNQPYLVGFYSARYNETLNYDPNSPQNQWARVLGMNQQGTMKSNVTMFANKYPWKEALLLFGGMNGHGAQIPQ